ncbi:hypothetical protein PTTG_25355 [Puccinia triticina 1-1 BBBD Race 1]|uniref:Uncharacterized protein n=1 Tax=Puccinia triticina (isolate 1-1 / race 1 (BBBD)) TaxID=630390 RepID=A0A180H3W2_PUCT1|nr:hypothetical protein PTTG_25355 [Puccinia triticina 1-1 BBBD Race 1]
MQSFLVIPVGTLILLQAIIGSPTPINTYATPENHHCGCIKHNDPHCC